MLTISLFFFFFNDTATTEIYTLSLHDALPIYVRRPGRLRRLCGIRSRAADPAGGCRSRRCDLRGVHAAGMSRAEGVRDRKSTRLNSSHANISYAVFCLKKKKHIEESNVKIT